MPSAVCEKRRISTLAETVGFEPNPITRVGAQTAICCVSAIQQSTICSVTSDEQWENFGVFFGVQPQNFGVQPTQ